MLPKKLRRVLWPEARKACNAKIKALDSGPTDGPHTKVVMMMAFSNTSVRRDSVEYPHHGQLVIVEECRVAALQRGRGGTRILHVDILRVILA